MRKVEITVASNMSEETYAYIREELGQLVKGEFEAIKRVDDAILGGFILNCDGEIYDLSVASQLKKMKHEIAKQ